MKECGVYTFLSILITLVWTVVCLEVPPSLRVAEIVNCKADIQQFCPNILASNNMQLFTCLQEARIAAHLSKSCDHDLWKFQNDLTKSEVFSSMSNGICKDDIDRLTCVQQTHYGGVVYCLIDHKKEIQDKSCHRFIQDASVMIFYDYNLMKPFLTACEDEITKLKCGRASEKGATNSQGGVLNCLATHVEKLKDKCQHQMLRVAELQADDFHLDKVLYFACRESREAVCPKVISGEGRVLKCLMNHKFDPLVSTECRTQLTKRQNLREYDYQVDYSIKTCSREIQFYNCSVEASALKKGVQLSVIMLCLENQEKEKENSLSAECLSELLDMRRQLMEDYKITPDIVANCHKEIAESCYEESLQRGGNAVHCLMRLIKASKKSKALVSDNCARSVKKLIHISDPTSDIRVDPIIGEACASLLQKGDCLNDGRSHGEDAYACLYRMVVKAESDQDVDKVCADRVLQLQYIIVRQFALNSKLYRACHKDAVHLCAAPKQWYSLDGAGNSEQQSALTFHCLYAKSKSEDPKDVLKAECKKEVNEVIRLQAHRIDLNPEVYDTCLPDLSKFCFDGPMEEEYRCLQKNVENLQSECKKAVVEFSEDQDEDPSLDVILAKACSPMIKTFCRYELGDVIKKDEIMNCLIQHKNDAQMNDICRAGIEHHQILALTDYHISHAFYKSCQLDAEKFCQGKTRKPDVIACLSEKATLEIVNKKSEETLSTPCRKQLRFELLQRSEGVKLDPRLRDACANDIASKCASVPDSEVKDCLREHRELLSPECQMSLFRREMLMAADNRVDSKLMRLCRNMIRRYCPHHGPQEIIKCLRDEILQGEDVDPPCRQLVFKRLETIRRDFRLDPSLQKFCSLDIDKHCPVPKSRLQGRTGSEFRGNVTQCLKDKYTASKPEKPLLTQDCTNYIRSIIIISNLNYHLDPILRNTCGDEIQSLCKEQLEATNGVDGDGQVVECLKRSLMEKKISSTTCAREVLRLISEGRADVHVDPILYRSCANELKTFCYDVPLGAGQQMSCLLSLRENKHYRGKISTTCSRQLEARVELWESAAKLAPPETFAELVNQVNTSGARSYLLMLLSGIILTIFISGMCCGRVTRRIRRNLKNK